MNVRALAAYAVVLMLCSCASRFTVYLDMSETMNMDGVTVVAIDTIAIHGERQKKVQYALTQDLSRLERAFIKRRARKLKPEVDKLSR